MVVRTVGGGLIDVSPRLASNINSDPLFAGNRLTGKDTIARKPPPSVNMGQNKPVFGNWFALPDSSLVGEIGGFAGIQVLHWLVLPGGSRIRLEDDEVEATSSWYDLPPTYTYTNVRVKLTRNTLPGLVAWGVLSQADANALVGTFPESPPSQGEVVLGSIRGIVIIAIIGALVYFVPRGILKGA